MLLNENGHKGVGGEGRERVSDGSILFTRNLPILTFGFSMLLLQRQFNIDCCTIEKYHGFRQ